MLYYLETGMNVLEIHAKHKVNLNDANLMEWDIETVHLLFSLFEFWRIVTISQNLISSAVD